jgi:hypothetical protein
MSPYFLASCAVKWRRASSRPSIVVAVSKPAESKSRGRKLLERCGYLLCGGSSLILGFLRRRLGINEESKIRNATCFGLAPGRLFEGIVHDHYDGYLPLF